MSYPISARPRMSAAFRAAAAVALLAVGGCVTSSTTTGGFPTGHANVSVSSGTGAGPVVSPNGSSSAQPFRGDPIGNDPCDIRLQDISGQLLLYYAIHQRLPAHLEELASVTELDQVPDYVCPVTHQPYSYLPAGLELRGDARRLIVFDAVPHGGKRRVILYAPAQGRQPPMMNAVELPERAFAAYTPAPASPPSTVRPRPIQPSTLPAPGGG